MIGKARHVGKKIWQLCQVCGTLTTNKGTSFGFSNIGFNCLAHKENKEKESLSFERINRNKSEEFSFEKILQDARMARFGTKNKSCEYCGDCPEELKTMRVFDDTQDKMCYTNLFLCQRDHEKAKQVVLKSVILNRENKGDLDVIMSTTILRKSFLMKKIMNSWVNQAMYNS
jgi:hypothetical protein